MLSDLYPDFSRDRSGGVIFLSLEEFFKWFIVIHRVKVVGMVNKAEIDVGILLIFQRSSGCFQFDLWFLCIFKNQLEHLEVDGSHIVAACLG